MALPEITVALSTIKGAVDLLKAVNEAKTQVDKNNSIIALQGQLLELQSRLSSIQSNYDQLYSQKQEIEAELKKLAGWKEDYVVTEIANGRYAYGYTGKSAPQHYLCQLCFDKGIKSVLHRSIANSIQSFDCKESDNHLIRL